MIRTLIFVVLLIIVVLLAAVFAWLNPGSVQLNLAFAEVDLEKSQAFALTLAVGWIFGALSATVLVLKLLRERRRLRKEARLAEAEADNLRSLPLRDGG
ncbi:MAG: lipopolysaccharide assembly protein LapA domain-containing protein [Gammaproteobacteria bacterium]|nr:lipopolysaccharide assembly protein LapA domain-containing protein [Gammaproteobacteria bacterium]MDH3767934.1 lipopolysaccharide assembly protein LapA domain-containing protein [Gammaproteobacteria bacterium]